MKAHLELVTTLSSAFALAVLTGCWTPDDHSQSTDAGAVLASDLCGVVKSHCPKIDHLPASGALCDLSASDVGSTFPPQLSAGYSGQFFSPGAPDVDAGILNGVNRIQSDPNNPNSYHYKGTIAGSATWGVYLNDPTLCPDGTVGGGGIDASAYDGVMITVGGPKPGPPGQMPFFVDSQGTPQDPYRAQRLQTVIDVPTTPTTFKFLWSELTAPCGKAADFQPGKIFAVGGSFLALTGIAYDFDVEIGVIGFCHATKGSPVRCE